MTYIRSVVGSPNASPEIIVSANGDLANVRINASIKDGTIARVGETAKFRWNATSTADPSSTVIVPNDGTNPGRWLADTIGVVDLPKADNSNPGIITLTGDLSGTSDIPVVNKINNQRVPWKSSVRFVLTSNVSNLSSFTVAQSEGTAVANDRILLAGQTIQSANGIYVVGTVSTGTAPLTRASDMAASADILPGSKVHVSEGILFTNTDWTLNTQGIITLGTTALNFIPDRVPTIAALRLINQVVSLASIEIQGYYAVGDGGEGHFDWDATNTATDDNGGIIRPNGVSVGAWVRHKKLHADVRTFGAKGDWRALTNCAINSGSRSATISGLTAADIGKRITITDAGALDAFSFVRPLQSLIVNVVGTTITLSNSFPAASFTVTGKPGTLFTDDTAAFNAGIAYLNSLGGGELFVPPSIYGFTNAINISSLLGFAGNITIRGAGKNSVLQYIDGGFALDFAHDGQNFGLVNLYGVNNCRVTNICLSGSTDCPADYTASPSAVYFASAGDCVVDHCWIQNFTGAAIFGSRTGADTGARLMQRMSIEHNAFNNCSFPNAKTALNVGNTIEAAGHDHIIQSNTFTHCSSPINMAGDHCLIAGNTGSDIAGYAIACGDSFSVEGNCVRGNSFSLTLDATTSWNNTIIPIIGGIVIYPPLGQGKPCVVSDNSIEIEIKNTTMLSDRLLGGFQWDVADVIFSDNIVRFKMSTNVVSPFRVCGFFGTGGAPQTSHFDHNEVRFFTDDGYTWSGNIGGFFMGVNADGYWTIISSDNRVTGVGTGSGVFAYNYTVGGTAHLKIQAKGDIYDSGSCVIGNAISAPNRPLYVGYDSTLPSAGLDAPFAFGIPVSHTDTDADAVIMRRSGTGDVIRGVIKDAHVSGSAAIGAGKIAFAGVDINPANINATGNLKTDGTAADQIQLSVKAHSSQTNAIFRFTDASSNILLNYASDGATLSFGAGVVNPMLTQLGAASGAGGTLFIRGQNAAGGSNATGGTVNIGGGIRDGSTAVKAGVQLGLNGGGEVMIEVAELFTGQRVMALAGGQPLNTALMPANTGDRVVFIASAGIDPTADPNGGVILYVNAGTGDLRIRGAAGGGGLGWNKGATTPKIYQADNNTASSTGQTLTIQAQNATAATSVGGNLNLTSGTGTSSNGTTNIQAAGITVASAIGTFFSLTKSRRLNVNNVVQDYTITGVDGYNVIAVGAIAVGITITLPSAPTAGDIYTIIDSTGIAGTHAISVAGNGKNINGITPQVLNTNYASITVIYSGTQWNITSSH